MFSKKLIYFGIVALFLKSGWSGDAKHPDEKAPPVIKEATSFPEFQDFSIIEEKAGLNDLPGDIWDLLFSYLKSQDLVKCVQTNKYIYEHFKAYRDTLLTRRLQHIDPFFFNSSYSNSQNFISLLQYTGGKKALQEIFLSSLASNGYVIIPHNFPSFKISEKASLITYYDLLPHKDFIEPLYKMFFKRDVDDVNFENENSDTLEDGIYYNPKDDNEILNNNFHHLWATWPFAVYVLNDDIKDNTHKFLEANKMPLTEWTKQEGENNFYWPFHFPFSEEDETYLSRSPCEIVIIYEKLRNRYNSEALENLLKHNPGHRLRVSLGDELKDSNFLPLNFIGSNIFSSLKQIKFVNPLRNITSIGSDFLSQYKSLTALDLSFFPSLTFIGENFLADCSGLTTLDLPSLTNVISIGYGFLAGCRGLTTVNLSVLPNLTTIGDWIMSDTGLTKINLSAHPNLTTIKDGFLNSCRKLTTANLSFLPNLTSIGDWFMGESALTIVNLSALPNLTTIGDSFLCECRGLTTVNLSDLPNLTSIGKGFLSKCFGLTAVNLSALPNLTTVGEGFLSKCFGLTTVNLSALPNLTTVGEGFLNECPSLTTVNLPSLPNFTFNGENFIIDCFSLSDKEKIKKFLQPERSISLQDLPEDIWPLLFAHLTNKDLITCAQTNKYLYEHFKAYRDNLLTSCLQHIDHFFFNFQDFTLLLQGPCGQIALEKIFLSSLTSNGYVIIPHNFPSFKISAKASLMTYHHLLPHEDFLEPFYKILFKRDMDDVRFDDEDLHTLEGGMYYEPKEILKDNLHHLWATWPFAVYVLKDKIKHNIHKFLETNQTSLTKWTNQESEKNSYWPFDFSFSQENEENEMYLSSCPCEIVMIYEQLTNSGSLEALEHLFQRNFRHRLRVSIGDDPENSNIFHLNLIDFNIISCLKQIKFLNPLRNVTSLGDGFLSGYKSLTALDLSFLPNLTSIGNNFLGDCSRLTTLDLPSLTNVTSIGCGFLNGCLGLTTVNLSALPNLTYMGPGFLSKTGITTVNLSTFPNLTSIGASFLNDCLGLTTVNLSALPNLTYIGYGFLYGCNGLTTVNLSALPNLTSIGEDFLNNCSDLTAVNLSALPNLTSIGAGFLNYCLDLTTLNLFDLPNLTYIGDAFLNGCYALTTVNLPSVPNLTFNGENFMIDCFILSDKEKEKIKKFLQPKIHISLQDPHEDIWALLFPHLNTDELICCAQTNKYLYEHFKAYRKNFLKMPLQYLDFILDNSEEFDFQDFHVLLQGEGGKKALQETFMFSLKSNGYVIIPHTFPLFKVLGKVSLMTFENLFFFQDSFFCTERNIIHDSYELLFKKDMNDFSFDKEANLLNSRMQSANSNENIDILHDNSSFSYLEDNIHHLWAMWPFSVYIPNNSMENSVHKFLEINKERLLTWIKQECKKASYYSFSYELREEDKTRLVRSKHRIVITYDQLITSQSNEALQDIFTENPDHKLLISVGENTKPDNSLLEITKDDIPPLLARIKFLNPFCNITTLGDYFLKDCTNLRTLDISPLRHITFIGDFFLEGCTALTTLIFPPSINVTSIADGFLMGCSRLRALELFSFTNVTWIGDYFLQDCHNLFLLNLSSLINLTSIGKNFLKGCASLYNLTLPSFFNGVSVGRNIMIDSPFWADKEDKELERFTHQKFNYFSKLRGFKMRAKL